ncbi:hypothetical protein Aperf_G00000059252 [Anoplocephala perfoliata]
MTGLSYYIPFSASTLNDSGRSTIVTVTCNHPQCMHVNYDVFGHLARINDHLYLGSLQALTPRRLRQMGITQVVSVMPEPIPGEILAQVDRHIQIPVDDIDYSNLRSHFDEIGDKIAREARRGGKTAVHCMAGISRSATVVLAYLMKHQRLSLSDAYNLVISVRPCIQPNIGFWRQLIDYEESLYGYRTMRINSNGFPEYAYVPSSARVFSYAASPRKNRSRSGQKY